VKAPAIVCQEELGPRKNSQQLFNVRNPDNILYHGARQSTQEIRCPRTVPRKARDHYRKGPSCPDDLDAFPEKPEWGRPPWIAREGRHNGVRGLRDQWPRSAYESFSQPVGQADVAGCDWDPKLLTELEIVSGLIAGRGEHFQGPACRRREPSGMTEQYSACTQESQVCCVPHPKLSIDQRDSGAQSG